MPAKRQRLKEADFDLSQLEWTSPSARGVRMAPKPVSKMKLVASSLDGEGGAKGKKASAKKSAAKKKGGGSNAQGDLF